MQTIDEYYMLVALKEAEKARKKSEVPVGAIIVKNDKIIAKAYNKVEKKYNSTCHAELLAIQKASKKQKNWRLDNCILYTTMEPCMMCCGAILQSRIKKIVYGIENKKHGATNNLKNVEIIPKILEKECYKIINSFFKKIR